MRLITHHLSVAQAAASMIKAHFWMPASVIHVLHAEVQA
jgi:hypothetical protein